MPRESKKQAGVIACWRPKTTAGMGVSLKKETFTARKKAVKVSLLTTCSGESIPVLTKSCYGSSEDPQATP